jgi:uroporphyrinogen decarboxylase
VTTRRQHSLTKRERVWASYRREEVDRPPVSLWQHFPERDQTAEDLAAATAAWQAHHDFDFVKFMPPGDYVTIDWGAESRYMGALGGTRTTTRFPVSSMADWESIPAIDVERGFNRVMLDAVAAARAALPADVPLLQTIFSPLTIAMKLSDNQAVEHLTADPGKVQPALEVIADVTRSMLAKSLERGADGIFFATQCADQSVMPEATYREYALPHDLRVLRAVPRDALLMLHLHGSQPMLSLHDAMPAGMLNWHDRRVGPSLQDIQGATGRPVAGGIDEQAIASRDPADVARQATEAIDSASRGGLWVTPGCVIPIDTPSATIEATTRAVTGAAQ